MSYDLFGTELADRLDSRKFGEEQLTLNADSGFHTELAQLPDQVPLVDREDYENYLSRLASFRASSTKRSRSCEGPRARHDAAAGGDRGDRATAAAHAVADAGGERPLQAPFADFPASVPAADRERLQAAGAKAIARRCCRPTARFRDFLVDEYLPRARTTLAAADLPDGREYYRYLIRHFTTLDLTPEAIHELGLAQVARIRGEMEAVMSEDRLHRRLRRLPRRSCAAIRASTRRAAEELLKEASFIAKRMDGKLPSLFRRLPRQPYGVAPVPAAMAPKYTSGRYVAAPVGRDAARVVLGQHLRPRQAAALQPRSADLPRGGARASSAGRAGAGARRACRSSGASSTSMPSAKAGGCTASGSARGRLLHRSVPRFRPPGLRSLARLPAGRRHRDPRLRLEPRAGDRLPRRQHHAAAARGRRPRSIATSPGPGRRSPTTSAS